MTVPTRERPLVTFAVFAYNQEKYIREAVQAAFAQSYEPLEIILSDDCSNDRTFEIMQEMAAAYEGPHEVLVRQNSENMNVAPHVLKVLREAKGDYFVLAAGDDVSCPLRTEKVLNHFKDNNAAGLHSGCRLVDEFGRILEDSYEANGDLHVRAWFQAEQCSFIHGATSAYSREVLKYVPEKAYYVHAEDGLLTTAILANGLSVSFLEERLVDYRTHASALSNSTVTKRNYESILFHEQKLSRAADSYLELCTFALEAVERSRSKSINKKEITLRIEKSVLIFSFRQKVYSSSFSQRLKALTMCNSLEDIKFAFSRVFGLKIFAIVKTVLQVKT